jgi:hypothetical protein
MAAGEICQLIFAKLCHRRKSGIISALAPWRRKWKRHESGRHQRVYTGSLKPAALMAAKAIAENMAWKKTLFLARAKAAAKRKRLFPS